MITFAPILFRVVQLLYFMAPAYAANIDTPVRPVLERVEPAAQPTVARLHKTAGGFAIGVLAAVPATFVQSRIAWEARSPLPSPG